MGQDQLYTALPSLSLVVPGATDFKAVQGINRATLDMGASCSPGPDITVALGDRCQLPLTSFTPQICLCPQDMNHLAYLDLSHNGPNICSL